MGTSPDERIRHLPTLAGLLLGAGATLLLSLPPGCGQVILTAPAGSTLTITANPPFIVAHGGVSVISVLVVEPAGTVVPDGTVVQFFTSLGSIHEQGRTNDGVARVNLLAQGRSGVAVVTAVSGGPEPEPSSTTTTTPGPTTSTLPGPTTTTPGPTIPTTSTTTTTTTTTLRPGPTTSTITTTTTTTTFRPGPGPTFRDPPPPPGFAQAVGVGQASVQVAIGTAVPARIVLTAQPSRITQPRSARIIANVIDENGNPVANVPVFFQLASPQPLERLDSQGRPVFTDFNGQAEDVLRTDAPTTAAARLVTVRALLPTGQDAFIGVTVN